MTNGAQGVSSQQFIDSQNKLRATKLKLLRAKLTIDEDNYYDALEPEEKAEAIGASLRLSTAILQIENAQIALIVANVEENAAALEQATGDLADALADVQNFTRLLNAITTLLGLVARIVAL